MTVKEMMESIDDLDENTVVLIATDPEGNGFRGIHEVSYPESVKKYGRLYEVVEGGKGPVRAAVIWPT